MMRFEQCKPSKLDLRRSVSAQPQTKKIHTKTFFENVCCLGVCTQKLQLQIIKYFLIWTQSGG
jgi:hypothetical protein